MAMKKKKKKVRAGKAYAQRKHAKRRFLQRTGILLTRELHDQLIAKISEGSSDAVFVEKQSNRVSVWDVTHKVGDYQKEEMTFRVVYDKMRRNITTVLNNVGGPRTFELPALRRRDVK